MAYFPFFIDISDKVCVVVGGGTIALRKIEVLSNFDAKIIVIATSICDEIYALKNALDQTSKNGEAQIILNKRAFVGEDILNATFVVAATDDESLNSRISKLCKKNNILVNVVDVKEECSFIFSAIVKQEDLVVAISTGGNCPALAANIKKKIGNVIPEYYGALIERLGAYRENIKNEIAMPEHRKQVYNELIHRAQVNEENISVELIEEVIKKHATILSPLP